MNNEPKGSVYERYLLPSVLTSVNSCGLFALFYHGQKSVLQKVYYQVWKRMWELTKPWYTCRLYSTVLVYVQNLGSPKLLQVLATAAVREVPNKIEELMQKRKMDLENSLESDSSSSFAGQICYLLDIFVFLVVFWSCKMPGKVIK